MTAEFRGIRDLDTAHGSEITQLACVISERLRPHLEGCTLLLVGSFSEGVGRVVRSGTHSRFVSDVDLVALLPDDGDMLSWREAVSEEIYEIIRAAGPQVRDLKIGLRYRFEREFGDFDLKCRSLGYPISESAVALFGRRKVPSARSNLRFGPGHAAENLCSKIWAIVRYADLPLTSSARRLLLHRTQRAEQCMRSTIRFMSTRRSHESWDVALKAGTGTPPGLRAQLQRVSRVWGSLALCLAADFPEACLRASEAEEFDIFRVAGQNGTALVRLLLLLLEFITDPDSERLAEQLRAGDPGLALGLEGAGEHPTPISRYRQLRYAFAARRMATSPLFARDRGPAFLQQLR